MSESDIYNGEMIVKWLAWFGHWVVTMFLTTTCMSYYDDQSP